jgi:hypothetical protein
VSPVATTCLAQPVFSRSLFTDHTRCWSVLRHEDCHSVSILNLMHYTVTKFWHCSNRLQERESSAAISIKQGRQCMCKGTLKRFRVTILAVEKQKMLNIMSVYLCSHSDPVCKEPAPIILSLVACLTVAVGLPNCVPRNNYCFTRCEHMFREKSRNQKILDFY